MLQEPAPQHGPTARSSVQRPVSGWTAPFHLASHLRTLRPMTHLGACIDLGLEGGLLKLLAAGCQGQQVGARDAWGTKE